jgi:hypothetical protein
MRRLVILISLVGAAWWLLSRRRPQAVRVSVGYVDGSAVSPPDGSPEQERLAAAARGAL